MCSSSISEALGNALEANALDAQQWAQLTAHDGEEQVALWTPHAAQKRCKHGKKDD